jgi:hypothetical protein
MDPLPTTGAVLPPIRSRFRALAAAIVPESAGLDENGWTELESIVETALSKRPAGMRRQLALFVRALDFLPRFRWLRPFSALGPERKARFLQRVQSSRVLLVRRGFWGLRTLVYMGYYARPEAYAEIGYDAQLRGWLEHPDASPEARNTTLRAATASGRPRPDRADPGDGKGGEP